ncbi:MAG TPA: hypothetical protein VN452_09385 [Longilinea sp.]|nr:hypothetical protein [Longilinea sp.]
MSRVINPDSAGKERNRLSRSVVLALRELMRQNEPNEVAHDLAAYISLALLEINETVETSVVAWEKRGYWVKADRFRLDWEWSDRLGQSMYKAILSEDWATVATVAAQVGQKLVKVTLPARNRLGTPWVGAWQQLKRNP